MPACNSETTIGLAIASVLLQTYANWELIVVDDGSDDRTAEIASMFGDGRIRFIRDGERRGIPPRRNEILSLARGKYMAWMDSDDISYPQRLAVEVAFLESRPDVDLVASEIFVFRNQGEAVGKRYIPADHETICKRPYQLIPMSQPAFMGRLSWFLKHGYNNRMKRAQDQDLLLRARKTSQYAGIQQILVGYRETHVSLKKIFLSRRLWVGSILRDASQNRMLLRGLAAILIQFAKICVEVVAVTTRLNYRILRHRALPFTEAERAEFESVFAAASAVAGEAAREMPEVCCR